MARTGIGSPTSPKILSANSGCELTSARRCLISLHPEPIGEVTAETLRVARAAFPKGTVVTRLRDEFSTLFEDADFHALYPTRGQPACRHGAWP